MAGVAAAVLLCTVVGVTDGDTLKARCGDQSEIRVRLAAIDAPEKAQPFGQRSKQSLSDLCFKKQAEVRTSSTDQYGRLIAKVRCGGRDASEVQVGTGMAWVYREYASEETALLAFENYAKAWKLGLWADSAPEPPWAYRKSKRVKPSK